MMLKLKLHNWPPKVKQVNKLLGTKFWIECAALTFQKLDQKFTLRMFVLEKNVNILIYLFHSLENDLSVDNIEK